MANRHDFSNAQKLSALQVNAHYLRDHAVDGILIAEGSEPLRRVGLVYYCENCMFCHTDANMFDVDHLVPDRLFRDWKKHDQSPLTINMLILCKSRNKGDLGCNQSKGSKLYVPQKRGLAYTHVQMDMNACPLQDRPFPWVG